MQRMMRWMRHFAHDTRGSVFVMVAVTGLGLIGAVGLSVDVGRAQMAENKLQNALDAAGLAAGASVNTSDLTEVVEKYLAANFDQGHLGARITGVTPVLSEDGQVLTVTATAQLDTIFMKIFGHDALELRADTEITRTNKGMELALVLDTTGSMCIPNCNKLDALRRASRDLLDILYGEKEDAENLWVGVVPFSQAVNVGNDRSNFLDATHFATLDWGPTAWAGCVEARWQYGNDVTDAPPATEPFKAYYWADHNSYNNWITESTNSNRFCTGSSCTCANKGPCECSRSGLVETCVSCSGSGSNRSCTRTTTTTGYTINAESGPNKYCPSALTRLSNRKQDALDGIAALQARGGTHVSEGAAWGYRLLSPRWRGLWGGAMDDGALPLDHGTPLMVKAAILMTDGENTMYNNADGAYGYLNQNQLGTTNATTATTRLNTKVSQICTAMKAQGIIVYTVVFDLSSSSVATMMRGCASSPDHYFDSPDEATLRRAFRTIGDSLANLRISR